MEDLVQHIGGELWREMAGRVPGVFDKSFWQGKLIEWAMRDPDFRIDLFRFVDVLPALSDASQIARHVGEYLNKPGRDLGPLMGTAVKMAAGGTTASTPSDAPTAGTGWMAALAAGAIRKNVEHLAERFITGPNPARAGKVLAQLWKEGFAFTADLLGETTLSEPEADRFQARYLELLDQLSTDVARWPAKQNLESDAQGPIPRANISLKISALEPHLDVIDLARSVDRLRTRVLPILLRARRDNVFVNFDLEQWSLHEITYRLFESCAMEAELRDWPHLGIVVQAYLKKSADDVERLANLVGKRNCPITVRLVKGAYWEYETAQAQQDGRPSPVWATKPATDFQFEKLTVSLMQRAVMLRPAIGTHNLRSVAHALAAARSAGLPENAWEIQMLYGMAEPLRAALAARGHRVRLYCPIGDLLPGMAYLVRRLLENTSNTGFLRQTYHEGADLNTLLQAPAPPAPIAISPATLPSSYNSSTPIAPSAPNADFQNVVLTDFTDAALRASFAAVVQSLPKNFPIRIQPFVGGQPPAATSHLSSPNLTAARTLDRPCPSHPSTIVTRIALASTNDAEIAVRTAVAAFHSWNETPLETRIALLQKLGDLLKRDRNFLATLEVHEVGKPWREADADVAEAIDYCRYYAARARIELSPQKMLSTAGQENSLRHSGRGPCAVIAPWNFPLAILCGMASAALVAGNPVILKPAEQSSAIAQALFERMLQAGFPPGAVQFLPGLGEEVGKHLVDHPAIVQIAFTGSKAVGLSILQGAAQLKPGQKMLKRVVCEMGGKNAIIVDESADLDEAVAGVLQSALGYAGQKCSACSRVLCVGSAFEPFMSRLADAAKAWQPAPPDDPACRLGPVIDAESFHRLQSIINESRNDPAVRVRLHDPSKLAIPSAQSEAPGYFLPATIFEVTDPNHRLMQEELFGPILTAMKCNTFSHALDVAMNSDYALTGAVFSRTPSHLDLAQRRFEVGNLYINRGCTGAVVGRQPFGGFRLSGLGTKAGGPGYLAHFAQPIAISHNTMRHGMAPELET